MNFVECPHERVNQGGIGNLSSILYKEQVTYIGSKRPIRETVDQQVGQKMKFGFSIDRAIKSQKTK